MRHHLRVSSSLDVSGATTAGPSLVIEDYDPCDWKEGAAIRVWRTIAPYMADGSCLVFCTEDRVRYRIRWQGGRAFRDSVKEVVWAEDAAL